MLLYKSIMGLWLPSDSLQFKKLFAVSRKQRNSTNDSDRLGKYLEKFGVKTSDLAGVFPVSGQMTTHFRSLAERKEKDPATRDFAVDEYAPVYHASGSTPRMIFFCGDSKIAFCR